MQQFKSLKTVLAYYADEKFCLGLLEKELWNNKPVCPHCGSERVYRLADGKQFKCGNKKTCDKKFNILTGTMYENTKIPLSTWFAAIWLMTSHISAKHLQRYCDEFSFRYNTRKIKDGDRFLMTIRQSKGRLKYYQLIAK